jgi:hypothetical protein
MWRFLFNQSPDNPGKEDRTRMPEHGPERQADFELWVVKLLHYDRTSSLNAGKIGVRNQ